MKSKSESVDVNPKVDKSLNLEDLTLNQLIQSLLSKPKATYYSVLFLGVYGCIYLLLIVLYVYAGWPCALIKGPIDGIRLMICGAGEVFPLNLFLIFFLLPILIIWRTIYLYKKDINNKRSITFTHSFDDVSWKFFVKLNDALFELSKSQYIWILEANDSVRNCLDKNERFVARSMFEDPSILNIKFFLNASKAKVKLFTLTTKNKKLIFLPTKLIIFGDKQVSAFNYDDLRVRSSIVKIAESVLQPTDAVKNGSILMYPGADVDLTAGKSKKLQLFNYEEIIISEKDVQVETIQASQTGAFFKLTQVLSDRKMPPHNSLNIKLDTSSESLGAKNEVIPTGIRWHKKNETTQIFGISIPCGMIYVGSLNPEETEKLERNSSLINIRLDVSHDFIDFSQRSFGYYPEYSAISPNARKAYLLWLASGCASTHVNIGYVFLYYYGLERRALMDLSLDDDLTELSEIQAEIRRLISIYGENRSFRSYANNLLTFLDESFTSRNRDSNNGGRFVGLNSRLREAANSQNGLSAELALEWVLATPDCSQRPIIVQSRYHFIEEFKRLYRHIKIDSDVVLKTVAPIIKYKAAAAELKGKEFSRPCSLSFELYPLPRDIMAVVNASCDALDVAKVAVDPPIKTPDHDEKTLNTREIPSRLAHHFAGKNQHQISGVLTPIQKAVTLEIQLNEERIAKIRKETGDVSKILTAIFEDTEHIESSLLVNGPRAVGSDSFGLDDAHLNFLKAVKVKPSWARSDFQELSKKLGVMMDGTIESINDVFLDEFDLPILEGDDPIIINQELLGKLKL